MHFGCSAPRLIDLSRPARALVSREAWSAQLFGGDVSHHPASPATTDIEAGLRVSYVSLIWTLVAGTAAMVIGIAANSLVLISFGVIGLLDAVGSGSLIV